jgi:hypothetical protein
VPDLWQEARGRQVLNDKSVVEAKSGKPQKPGQIANNKKFVADGGTVTYKLRKTEALKPNGDPTQRGQSLIDSGFKLVGV